MNGSVAIVFGCPVAVTINDFLGMLSMLNRPTEAESHNPSLI
jgi:hypothetical protein